MIDVDCLGKQESRVPSECSPGTGCSNSRQSSMLPRLVIRGKCFMMKSIILDSMGMPYYEKYETPGVNFLYGGPASI